VVSVKGAVTQLLRQELAVGAANVGEHDERPFVDEEPSFCSTLATSCARDERHLAVESSHGPECTTERSVGQKELSEPVSIRVDASP